MGQVPRPHGRKGSFTGILLCTMSVYDHVLRTTMELDDPSTHQIETGIHGRLNQDCAIHDSSSSATLLYTLLPPM